MTNCSENVCVKPHEIPPSGLNVMFQKADRGHFNYSICIYISEGRQTKVISITVYIGPIYIYTVIEMTSVCLPSETTPRPNRLAEFHEVLHKHSQNNLSHD